MRRLLSAPLAIALLALASTAQAEPRSQYLLHCAGCHLADASGIPALVPPLAGTLGRIAGSRAGRDYLARVPGSAQAPLTDEQLAAVLNWLLFEFNRDSLPPDFRPLRAAEVGKARAQVLADPLRFRRELWPDIEGDPRPGS